MTYCGRVEIRAIWEDGEVQDHDVNFMPQRGWCGDALILEGSYVDEALAELLSDRADGVYDIAAKYFEEFHQDYWGDWDGEFYFENERVRYVGQLLESK